MEKATFRKKFIFIAAATLFAVFLGSTADSRPKPLPNRQRVMEKIETIKMWKLMDALNLDSETALKVFPIIKAMDEKRTRLIEQKRALLWKLRQSIRDKTSEKAAVDSMAAKLFDLTERICALSREEYQKLKGVLTEEQLGRYLLFQQRFRRELIKRWVQERGGGMRKPPRKKMPSRPLPPAPSE